MHQDVKRLFREALEQTIVAIKKSISERTVIRLRWTREENGRWTGTIEEVPDLSFALSMTRSQMDHICTKFFEALTLHHPEFLGLMGTPQMRMLPRGSQIITSARDAVWDREGSLDASEPLLNDIADEFEAFVDNDSVSLTAYTRLGNITVPHEPVSLPGGFVIRPLTEKEAAEFYPHTDAGILRWFASPDTDCILEKHYSVPKCYGDARSRQQVLDDDVSSTLLRCLMGLRSFKTGAVSYDALRIRARSFWPFPFPQYPSQQMHLGWHSNYRLTDDDITSLQEFMRAFLANKDASIELACSRLSDAEVRTRWQDHMIDSAIGLEALLLSSIEGRYGELRYRFALHYGALHENQQERREAFLRARSVYDVRSAIAHGGELKNTYKFGSQELSGQQIADNALEMLRTVIKRFLLVEPAGSHKKQEFWDDRYFGPTSNNS